MTRIIDMTGRRFGRLLVLSRASNTKHHKAAWLCKCKCGNQKIIAGGLLRSKKTQSCGCIKKEWARSTLKSLIGFRFGRLTVIERAPNRRPNQVRWICRCDCGTLTDVAGSNLKNNTVLSCKCLQREVRIRSGHSNKTHGMTGTREFHSWQSMKQRCLDKNYDHYADYGGRGIKICKRWLKSFQNFYADMGPRPKGHSLDRYPNPDGNYEPKNCRWATPFQQRWNRRKNSKRR